MPAPITVRISRWSFVYWLLLYPWWKRNTWTLDENGVTHRHGWLGRHETRLKWARMQDCSISRGLFARMMGYGSVTILSAGEHSGGMKLTFVSGALEFYTALHAELERREANVASIPV